MIPISLFCANSLLLLDIFNGRIWINQEYHQMMKGFKCIQLIKKGIINLEERTTEKAHISPPERVLQSLLNKHCPISYVTVLYMYLKEKGCVLWLWASFGLKS